MVETKKRFIDHAYYNQGAVKQDERIGINMCIDKASVSAEQMDALIEVLEQAARKANEIMQW